MQLLNADTSLGADNGCRARLGAVESALKARLDASVLKRGIDIGIHVPSKGAANALELGDTWAEVLKPACAVDATVK